MTITHLQTRRKSAVSILSVADEDFKTLTVKRYFFNWRKLKDQPLLYKLVHAETGDILGLVWLLDFQEEERIEIKLLAVSVENRGYGKQYDGIAGNLIAFACRMALGKYGKWACVSLVPKTELKPHYMNNYGMQDAGWQVYLDGRSLLNILKTYIP